MAEWEDVLDIVASLPGVSTGLKWGRQHWMVDGKGFAWDRPFSKADVKRLLPATPPEGPILGLITEDLHDKEAILAEGRPFLFTIEHFKGYPAVLAQVSAASVEDLRRVITDAWLVVAPQETALEHLRTTEASASKAAKQARTPAKPKTKRA